MSDIVERLRASLRLRAFDGDALERSVCAQQMSDAAMEIERLRAKHEELEIGWRRTYDHDVGLLKAEIERLRKELDGADSIANCWQKQNIELRHLLRFFFENVPVNYQERYADVMKKTEEILGRYE